MEPGDLLGRVLARLEGRLGELGQWVVDDQAGSRRWRRSFSKPTTRVSPLTSIRPPRPIGRPQVRSVGIAGHAGRPDHQVDRHRRAVLEVDPVGVHLGDRGLQPDVHAALDQLTQRVLAQRVVERGQQVPGHLDQHHVHPRRVELGIGGGDRLGLELGQLAGHLDPGRAAADDHHGEAAGVRIGRAGDESPGRRRSCRGPAAPRPGCTSTCVYSAAPGMPKWLVVMPLPMIR